MKKPTNKAERDALIKELQAMTFNEMPKRWDELEGYHSNPFSKGNELIETGIIRTNRHTFPTSEQAEASIYLAMLMQLRDVYREGWLPDWGDLKVKYSLLLSNNEWKLHARISSHAPFSFQTKERAELFLENFGDYLEKVKPLFS